MMTLSRVSARAPSVPSMKCAMLVEIGGAGARPGKHHRQRLLRVGRIEQHAEQVQDLLGGADTAGKHDDAVRQAQERLEPLFDVRHDDQLVDDRVRRLGGDDAGLGDAEKAAMRDALLGVPHAGALHRRLHRARAAAGADIECPQAELVADALGVAVFGVADRVPAPAHHQIRPRLDVQHARVAQDMKHRVGDRGRIACCRAVRR